MSKTIQCPICGMKYPVASKEVKNGLFDNGELLACSQCFCYIKEEFWKDIMRKLKEKIEKEEK